MNITIYKDIEILKIIDELSHLYRHVFSADEKMRELFIWRVEKSIRTNKHPIVITSSLENKIVGAVFGFDYTPENYWAKTVQQYLPPHYDWFHSSFEVNELYVDSNYQGKGIGGALLEKLIREVPHQNLLLSTKTFQNEKVLMFYQSHGFRVVASQVIFEHSETIYSILAYQK